MQGDAVCYLFWKKGSAKKLFEKRANCKIQSVLSFVALLPLIFGCRHPKNSIMLDLRYKGDAGDAGDAFSLLF